MIYSVLCADKKMGSCCRRCILFHNLSSVIQFSQFSWGSFTNRAFLCSMSHCDEFSFINWPALSFIFIINPLLFLYQKGNVFSSCPPSSLLTQQETGWSDRLGRRGSIRQAGSHRRRVLHFLLKTFPIIIIRTSSRCCL